MIVFKAAQVVACVLNEPKEWEMGGRKGTSHTAKLACIGPKADVASITLKATSADLLLAKIDAFTIGKPADIEIKEIIPVFKSGDRRAASYELVA
jgi:hypothetical protein